jgi:hypothetical protein
MLGLRHVLVANDRDGAEFRHTAEHLGSYVGATSVVTEVFSEQFFAPVWSREARTDRHLRNRESPKPNNSTI